MLRQKMCSSTYVHICMYSVLGGGPVIFCAITVFFSLKNVTEYCRESRQTSSYDVRLSILLFNQPMVGMECGEVSCKLC
jgi:hypothetical protein